MRWFPSLTLAGELFADAAEGLRGDAEVGCDLVLRNLFHEQWICFDEREIAFLGRGAEGFVDTPVGGNLIRFQEQTEVALHHGNRFEHFVPCLFFQEEHFGVL